MRLRWHSSAILRLATHCDHRLDFIDRFFFLFFNILFRTNECTRVDSYSYSVSDARIICSSWANDSGLSDRSSIGNGWASSELRLSFASEKLLAYLESRETPNWGLGFGGFTTRGSHKIELATSIWLSWYILKKMENEEVRCLRWWLSSSSLPSCRVSVFQ